MCLHAIWQLLASEILIPFQPFSKNGDQGRLNPDFPDSSLTKESKQAPNIQATQCSSLLGLVLYVWYGRFLLVLISCYGQKCRESKVQTMPSKVRTFQCNIYFAEKGTTTIQSKSPHIACLANENLKVFQELGIQLRI
jgi:hypothetical protein